MELTYRQLETTLAAHLQINPDRISTFRSRIKQLQRLEFPGGVNIGRGAKMAYTGEHLFKLVTAFELIGIGLSAQFVTELVELHWKKISAAYALNSVGKRYWGSSTRVYVRFILQSMHEIQFSKHKAPIASHVIVEDEPHLTSLLGATETRSSFCYPVLVISDLMERVTNAAETFAGVMQASNDREALGWLPQDKVGFVLFKGPYPDRGNLKMRKHLNRIFQNDPESETPEGVEEARDFIENGLTSCPF